MSQRSRPGTGQKATDLKRMPFEAAEALLWGKATFEQHGFLYKRMQELEQQHTAYHSRIQSTELVAQAAEAATSRIRHLEQQVAVIEADEPNKPFNDWITAEVEGVKGFIEQNKNIRPRVIQLENEIATGQEDKKKVVRLEKVVEGLVKSIKEMDERLKEHLERIGSLQRTVNDLSATSYIPGMAKNKPHRNPFEHSLVIQDARIDQRAVPEQAMVPSIRQTGPKSVIEQDLYSPPERYEPWKEPGQSKPPRGRKPSPYSVLEPVSQLLDQQLDPTRSEPTEETDIEEENACQVQMIPKIEGIPPMAPAKNRGTPRIFDTSPILDSQKMSARLRVMQRKSIYNPKITQDKERASYQGKVTAALKADNHKSKHIIVLPETHLVARPVDDAQQKATERPRVINGSTSQQLIVKFPVNLPKSNAAQEPYAPRLTRSQAQAHLNIQDHGVSGNQKPAQAQQKAIPRTREADKPKQIDTLMAPVEKKGRGKRAAPAMIGNVDANPAKRKKPNVRSSREEVQKKAISCAKPTSSPKSGAKSMATRIIAQSSPKKAAPKRSNIQQRHQPAPNQRSSDRLKKSAGILLPTETQPDWETYQEMVRQGLVKF